MNKTGKIRENKHRHSYSCCLKLITANTSEIHLIIVIRHSRLPVGNCLQVISRGITNEANRNYVISQKKLT